MTKFYLKPKQESELYHYGVLSMKWGKRKKVDRTTNYDKVQKKQKARDDAKKRMLKAKENRKNDRKAYRQSKKEYRRSKWDHFVEINKTNEKYSENDSRLDNLLGGNAATVNRLLNTNKNMTLKEARKQAYFSSALDMAEKALDKYGEYKMNQEFENNSRSFHERMSSDWEKLNS